MSRLTVRWPAPDDARFASDAFDSAIGGQLVVRFRGTEHVGRLTDATVVDGGAAVMLTMDVEGFRAADVLPPHRPGSITAFPDWGSDD